MPQAPSYERSNWKPPTLLIDFRCGNVEMLHEGARWIAPLPLSSPDCSQINTPQVTVESNSFVPLPDNEG